MSNLLKLRLRPLFLQRGTDRGIVVGSMTWFSQWDGLDEATVNSFIELRPFALRGPTGVSREAAAAGVAANGRSRGCGREGQQASPEGWCQHDCGMTSSARESLRGDWG